MSDWLKESLWFNLVWLITVLGQSVMVSSALLLLWFVWRPLANRDLLRVAGLALAGIVIDTLLMSSGWLSFSLSTTTPGGLPLWLGLLWLGFSRFLHAMITQVAQSPLLLTGLFLPGGVASYLAGESLGLVTINWQHWPLSAGFLLWWCLLPMGAWWLFNEPGARHALREPGNE